MFLVKTTKVGGVICLYNYVFPGLEESEGKLKVQAVMGLASAGRGTLQGSPEALATGSESASLAHGFQADCRHHHSKNPYEASVITSG